MMHLNQLFKHILNRLIPINLIAIYRELENTFIYFFKLFDELLELFKLETFYQLNWGLVVLPISLLEWRTTFAAASIKRSS